MTNLEALKANITQVHGIVLGSNAFVKACIDNEIEENVQYTKSDAKIIDIATVQLLEKVLEAANLNEGDLQYSQTNKEHIKTVIDSYLTKWGLDLKYSVKPIITSKNVW